MVDITHKRNSLRTAIAQATVKVSQQATIRAIEEHLVPKGNVFEMAKTAGLFAVKRTSDMIPDCHPLPVEYTKVSYEIEDLSIHIQMEVRTIYRTGVEVEAMHGVSVVALTMYDMLKPIDKGIEIQNIKLIGKKGGKSDFKNIIPPDFPITYLQCTDAGAEETNGSRQKQVITDLLSSHHLHLQHYASIPNEQSVIRESIQQHQHNGLILLTSKTKSAKAVLEELLDQPIASIGEMLRQYKAERNPGAFPDLFLGGWINDTLVVSLPGKSNDLQDALIALFPYVLALWKKEKKGND